MGGLKRLAAGVLTVIVASATGAATCGDSGEGGSEEPERLSPQERIQRARGRSCEGDPGCPSYLRCLDGQCEEPPAMVGEGDSSTADVKVRDGAEETVARFDVELADTRVQRHRGLMYRPDLAEGWGMLFVYDGEAPRTFWMKNTEIPLDMIFADATGEVVEIVHSAEPETTRPRRCEAPARFVLEVRGGVAKRHGISEGHHLVVSSAPERLRPRRE